MMGNSSQASALMRNWELLRYFLAVARAGTIGGAAQNLLESAPTVSRRVRDLERLIGMSLFERTAAGVTLTEMGERILESALKIESEILSIGENAETRTTQPEGKVVITGPCGLGSTMLIPRLAPFQQSYPNIDVDLMLTTEKLSLRNREADIAIRIGDPKDHSLIGNCAGQVRYSLYAHRKYLAQYGTPDDFADLADHTLVKAIAVLASTPQNKLISALAPNCRRLLSVNDVGAQARAIAEGYGFGPLPRYVVETNADLVEILPGKFQCSAEIWVLCHAELRNVARVRAVRQLLSAVATDAAAA